MVIPNGIFRWKATTGGRGLTYGKKTTSFSAQVMPGGCIFSFEGMGVFPAEEDLWWVLAYLNSTFVRWYLNATCGLHKNPPYVRNVPVPNFSLDAKKRLEEVARSGWFRQLRHAQHDERSPVFVLPIFSKNTIDSQSGMEAEISEIDAIVKSEAGWFPLINAMREIPRTMGSK